MTPLMKVLLSACVAVVWLGAPLPARADQWHDRARDAGDPLSAANDPAQASCTAVGDGYATPFQLPLTVPAPGVLANDFGCGANPIAAGPETPAGHGVVVLRLDGGFTYTPAPGYFGTDSFTYRVLGTDLSNPALVVVTVNPPVIVRPLPPTNLYASSVAGDLVTLRWVPPTAGPRPTDYELLGGIAALEVLAVIPTGSVEPIYTFRAPRGAFYVRMRTVAGGVRSDPSDAIRLYVGIPVPPSATDRLTSVVDGSTVNLAWRNTFTGGAAATVYLQVGSTLGTWFLPVGLTETLSVSDVPGDTYALRVWAVNDGGVSQPSSQITVTVPAACAGPPRTPGNFLAYVIGRTIHVVWEPPPSGPAHTGYELIVGGAFVGRLMTSSRALSGNVWPGSYQLSALATNACGSSPQTPPQTVAVP
jgi:hypothetical protein